LLLACAWLVSPCAVAQSPEDPAPSPGEAGETPGAKPEPGTADDGARPTLRVGKLPDDIRLDGRLDEPAWAGAEAIETLTMVEPVEGGVPSRRTVVRVLASERALVFGILCHHDDPDEIVSYSVERDASLDGQDHVHLVLGTYRDGRSGYVFTINPTGARHDAIVTDRGEGENVHWDGIWEAGTARVPEGWSAEIRIPLLTLGFREGLSAWHFNVERYVSCLNETCRWAATSRHNRRMQTNLAGLLTGLPAFDQGLGLSVRLTGTGRVGSDASDERTEWEGEPSLDVTQRLAPDLLASLTVNTDFAETEVDARRINLTRFPLFFPEKRSFFLEGADQFDFGLGTGTDVMPYYSRRIGLVSGREVPLHVGTKLHGRADGTAMGVLGVRTGREDDVGPATWLGVARVRQDVFEESNVGMIATVGDPTGRGPAWTGGADFTYQTSRFLGDRNFLAGIWGLATGGERVDGGSRSAFGAKLDYPNDEVDLAFYYKRIGEDFDPALGFVPRPGVQIVTANMTYSPHPEACPWLREMDFEVKGDVIMDLEGCWESYEVQTTFLDFEFESGDLVYVFITPEGEFLEEPFEIADGVVVPAGEYHWTRTWVGASTSSRRPVSGGVGFGSGGFYDGTLTSAEADLVVRLEPYLKVSCSAERKVGRLEAGDFRAELYAARARLLFSTDLYVNSFVQYDTESRLLGSNTRLHWAPSSITDLFLVFNYTAGRVAGMWEEQAWEVLLKFQYTFRS
jgi:hypothetical protein